MQETKVVLGMEDHAVEEEVLHFLDRLPGVRVVGVASDGIGVSREIHDRRPEAIVVSPGMAAKVAGQNGAALLVVGTQETTHALRTAMRVGARGFYVWPDERDTLGRDAQGAARPRIARRSRSGRVVAVCGARGGAGGTFLATNLAAAFTDRGLDTVLADFEVTGADLVAALGMAPDAALPTLSDLLGLAGELTREHLDRALHAHARGFRTLLAPARPRSAQTKTPDAVASIVRHLRSSFETVVLHLPRNLDETVAAATAEADVILLVVTLDVLALRHAKHQLELLEEVGIADRCRLVLNRVGRGEIVPEDARRVLGLSPVCQIRVDPAVPRAQNRGELVAGRPCAAGRRVLALAKRLLDGEAS
jgi:pilus assembly protein CpaE